MITKSINKEEKYWTGILLYFLGLGIFILARLNFLVITLDTAAIISVIIISLGMILNKLNYMRRYS